MNPPDFIEIPSPDRRRRPSMTASVQGGPFACAAFFIMMVAILVRRDAACQTATSTSATSSDPIQQRSSIERGKHLGHVITPQDLHKAYREIQEDYHAKAFGSNGWTLLNAKDGINISMLHHSSDPDCPYVKMTSIMPVSPQDCWNFLALTNWDKTMPYMDPFYEGVSIFKTHHHRGVSMTLARKRTKRLLALGKRDFLFVSVADLPLRDGTLVSGTVSVVAPHVAPRQKGYTRAFQDSIAFYKPLDSGSKTELTIICRIDLNDSGPDGEGGFMPMWLYVKTIGATGARSVLSMRNYLERARQQNVVLAASDAAACQRNRLHDFVTRLILRSKIA